MTTDPDSTSRPQHQSRTTNTNDSRSRPQSRTTDAHTDSSEPADEDTVLELEGVTKHFGTETAVEECSLSVREGELLTFLGPSGCGKTTILRILAGLERPDVGTVRLNGDVIADENTFVPAQDRPIGLVFQNFALFPHLTAGENVAFGLTDLDDAERDRRVEKLLELVDLSEYRDSDPSDLSGGQQQRIALARSLAPEPDVLLLDEPFSNLDVDLRVEMREDVRRILNDAGVTGITVTHDQEEALSISDRVAVVNDGRLEQIDTPEAVFQRPTSRFVAGFLGHATFLTGHIEGDLVKTTLGPIGRDRIHGLALEYDRTDIDVLVRPDDLLAHPAGETEADGRVIYRRYLGPTVLYRVELETGEIVEAMHNHADLIELDEPVTVSLAATHDFAWFPTERDHPDLESEDESDPN